MFTGRGRHAVDWTPEYNNRCDPRYKLDLRHPITGKPLIDSEHLWPFIIEQIAPCLQVATLARQTWASFCANANSWMTPGAPSGCHIRYNDPCANPIRDDVTKRILFEYLGSAHLLPFITLCVGLSIQHLREQKSESHLLHRHNRLHYHVVRAGSA